MRAGARLKRFVGVPGRGVIVIPPTTRSRGPWLDATRATSLQRIANRPIVCHVLDALRVAGVEETALLTPEDLAEEIATCIEGDGARGAALRYLPYDPQAEPEEALRAVARFAEGAPTIVHRADGLVGQPLGPFLELLRDDGADIVLLVVQGARNTECLGPATQQMLRVAELDPANAGMGMAGVCVLGAGALDDLCVGECPRGLEPGALAEWLLARESTHSQVRVVREWRAFAGEALDLLGMNRAVLDGLEHQVSSAQQRDGNRFEGRVFIDATASVTSSVICGPVIVGAGAHVADSYIGPHTSIGERVHVEGAEIERSIVFAGASIVHVGGRLVGSVVGREARVFRDFSMPRAMRLQVGDGDEVALC
jgi:glucose-1-phosphate thymidylyltransferase